MYIELHTRSAFSFLEGASLPEELAATCSELDTPAMALLDTDNVCGAPRFYMAAKKLGITAHMGAEITLDDGRRRPWTEQLTSIYGPSNVYVELQRHLNRDEEARNQAAMALAASLNLPLLATNGVRHAAPHERELLDVLTCVREKTTIGEA